jgi:hypothetical protein
MADEIVRAHGGWMAAIGRQQITILCRLNGNDPNTVETR